MPIAAGGNAVTTNYDVTVTAINSSTTASSMSSPSSCLESSLQCLPSLDVILEELTVIARETKALEHRRQCLLDALDQLVESGEAESALTWNDYKITRRSRNAYTFPDYINDQANALKQAKEVAVALGEAKITTSNFWEVRAPKA